MKLKKYKNCIKILLCSLLFSSSLVGYAQDSTAVKQKSAFWKKVHFGGGLGLNFGNNATNITIAPSGVYEFNKYISAGVGLQGSYVSFKDYYKSYIYGGSLIALLNPVESLQLSVELEKLRVNTNFTSNLYIPNKNSWNTALFVGVGYVTNNVTLGVRYNVLFNENDNVYVDAFMPFIRVYF